MGLEKELDRKMGRKALEAYTLLGSHTSNPMIDVDCHERVKSRARGNILQDVAGLLVVLAATTLSCTSRKASMVVGIQSEPMGGVLASIHVVLKVDGVTMRDETLVPAPHAPLAFPRPWEARLSSGRDGTGVVDVEIEAFDAVSSSEPLLRRVASARFVPGRESLLRIRLEPRCIVYPSPPRPPGSPPGPLNGPVCEAPSTCIRGTCQSAFVRAETLEPYTPRWASQMPDPCKPRDGGGAPTVEVGTGQAAYAAMTRGQVLRAEPGPQGGHHIWIAARVRNLSQAGSTTTISAVEPGSGRVIPPSAFQFPFDPGEEETCELYGLRFQLDQGGIDYTQFLGKPLDVTVTVADPTGASAVASAHVRVASELAFGPAIGDASPPRRSP